MANVSYGGSTGTLCCVLRAGCGLLLLLTWLTPARAQTATSPAHPGTPGQSTAAAHHRRARHKKPIPMVAAPVVPPPPPPPVLPADQPAVPAKITYSPGSLRIDAENSSLVATLNDISKRTGVSIEGLGSDERIYGQYGPGPVAATLSKLLDGSGYDYVVVGGGAGKPPAKLLLSPAGTASASVGGASSPVIHTEPVAGNGESNVPANPSEPVRPKTPQQIFDELRRMHPQQ